MFARILEFVPLMEKKDEFIRVVKKEVLPILKKHDGFVEMLPLLPESKTEKVLAVTLWTNKKELELYEKGVVSESRADPQTLFTYPFGAQALRSGNYALRKLRKDDDGISRDLNHWAGIN